MSEINEQSQTEEKVFPKEILSEAICYACMSKEGQLLRPCNNIKCSAKVHIECIEQQCKNSNVFECGVCKNPVVIITKSVRFRKNKCAKFYFKLIYILIMMTVAPLSIYALSFGNSGWDPRRYPYLYTNSTLRCTKPEISFFCAIFFGLFFIQIPLFCTKNKPCHYNIFCCAIFQNLKYKSYMTMFILYLTSISLVLLAHGVGTLIYTWWYNDLQFFTCETSLAGYTIYGIIIIFVAIILLLRVLWLCSVQKFTESDFDVNLEIVGEQTKLL